MNNVERFGKLAAAALVSLFVALLALFLALMGVINMVAAQVVLVLAWCIASLFLWVEVFPGEKGKKAASVIVLTLVLAGLDVWTIRQQRSHVYVTRTEFALNGSIPTGPRNFANVIYRNESVFGVDIWIYFRIGLDDVYLNDPAKQRKLENYMFSGMLQTLTRPDANPVISHVPAHGERYMSRDIPLPSEMISDPTKAVYFMGRIHYKDEHGEHDTDFCTYVHNTERPVFDCLENNEAH